MLAQGDPVVGAVSPAVDAISRGGTTGLIIALCLAVGALVPICLWLLKRLLAEKDARLKDSTAWAAGLTDHVRALDRFSDQLARVLPKMEQAALDVHDLRRLDDRQK